jgi:hypothetical protein
MEDILLDMIGKKIDLVCNGGASIRGTVLKASGGVLHLQGEESVCYVAIDKIAVVWGTADDPHRAGFLNVGALNAR